jgi:hypothetical protein
VIQFILGKYIWLRGWLPKMNTVNDLTLARWMPGLWCALFFVVCHPSGALAQPGLTNAGSVDSRIAFLSKDPDGPRPVEETPPAAPPEDNRNFDGVWTFTSAGCRYTGSLPARIIGGNIFVRGGSGQVDPDGTLHSVGAGNGMTLTAIGQLSGNTGSGTFNRSDGCIGSWIAIKRGPLSGRRP